MRNLILLFIALFLTACSSSVHLSQVNSDPNIHLKSPKMVEVETSQDVVMGFAFDTNYVDKAYTQIMERCPTGASMVNVEYVTKHGFLHWTNIIRVKAQCDLK
ncbi:hypothetical protein M9194_12745 [Vibrio sp. S4M6]|uniref:hypothetical protein n=1 Tax=Vibrio sinus TaxID=2946865 RepID=UPI002029C706|nr:hypothetical protein [Vibrio sinus]MCL9782295.1 hypothetical protein [Vibrio sinus]